MLLTAWFYNRKSVCITKTSQLMLYREIMAVCSEIHTKHINTLCGQNVELLNVKLAVHIVTSGLQRIKTDRMTENKVGCSLQYVILLQFEQNIIVSKYSQQVPARPFGKRRLQAICRISPIHINANSSYVTVYLFLFNHLLLQKSLNKPQ